MRLSRVTWLGDLCSLPGGSVWRKPWKQSTLAFFFFFNLTFTICTSKSREEVVTKPLSLLAWWGSGVSELRQWLLHLRCFHYALGSTGRIQEAWFPSCPKVLWTTLKRCPKLQKTWLHKMVAALKYTSIMALTAATIPTKTDSSQRPWVSCRVFQPTARLQVKVAQQSPFPDPTNEENWCPGKGFSCLSGS